MQRLLRVHIGEKPHTCGTGTKFSITKFLSNKIPNNKVPKNKVPK
jgi:hypothetical protein